MTSVGWGKKRLKTNKLDFSEQAQFLINEVVKY